MGWDQPPQAFESSSWSACSSPRLERIQRMRLFKVIADRCKRTRVCFSCGAVNGPVKYDIHFSAL